MGEQRHTIKVNWFWGLIGLLGSLGLALGEPAYYVFFLFFLEPIVRNRKS